MKVLVAGNTGYLTREFILKTFPQYEVVITGDPLIKSSVSKKITVIQKNYQQVQDILNIQHFDKIIYFSAYLTFNGKAQHEMEELNALLEYCEKNNSTKFLYVTRQSRLQQDRSKDEVILKQGKEVCYYYASVKGLDIKVIESPYLYSISYSRDFLYQLFKSAAEKKEFELRAAAQEGVFFISLADLSKLIHKIFDSWKKGYEVVEIPLQDPLLLGSLSAKIPDLEINFLSQAPVSTSNEISETATVVSKYSWQQNDSLNAVIADLYAGFSSNWVKTGFFEKFNNAFLKKHRKLIALLEVIAAFFLCIFLNNFAVSNAQFKLIDIKLLYVVMAGTIYGIDLGLVAASLASGLLIYTFVASGTDWLTLFYDPTNWLPFIGYYIVAAVCGYLQIKSKDSINFWEKESTVSEDKCQFIRELYEGEVKEGKKLQKQILGNKNSFGKIFEVTQRLDSVEPAKIFNESIRVLEELLENKSISIYRIEKNSSFARLQVASSDVLNEQPFSLDLKDYKEILTVIKSGEVWVNHNLDARFPMYVTDISQNSQPLLMITIAHTDYTQMSLYYENLFKVLCGLVQNAVLKALFYKETVYGKLHYNETTVLKEEAFVNELKIARQSKEGQNSLYELLKIKVKNTDEIKAVYLKVKDLIRASDILGATEKGDFYLLLTQISSENLPLVLERFSKAGVKSQVVLADEEEEICAS
ncbi:DUF4118 domain-containing protein [Liquorilactobacillus oeni]|uniref:Nucleoside-diphosphate-sugar epimerase n=1 Tax=Liquorilactobacillus oeni DSM 19972 TaxID=1423777 RepID=A0A0R1M9A4_9LACO|nr:DUF4118 domain-containing protein [Liquorilactobacillus oeni]KRL04513.1 hypothetical protein FD46_GL001644 [Liquorilactobacillus oeni DSM 19972]